VRITQDEKQLCLPVELDMPWSYMQRRFDITSPSGNIMSNVICNLDPQGRITYPINEGMSDAVKSTELAWCEIFCDSESMVGTSCTQKGRSILILPLGHSTLLWNNSSYHKLPTG